MFIKHLIVVHPNTFLIHLYVMKHPVLSHYLKQVYLLFPESNRSKVKEFWIFILPTCVSSFLNTWGLSQQSTHLNQSFILLFTVSCQYLKTMVHFITIFALFLFLIIYMQFFNFLWYMWHLIFCFVLLSFKCKFFQNCNYLLLFAFNFSVFLISYFEFISTSR